MAQAGSTMLDSIQTLDDVPAETYAPPPQQQQQAAPQYHPEPQASWSAPPQAVAQPAPIQNAATWNTTSFIAMVTSAPFLKALATAFVAVFVVCAFPVEDFIFKHVPMTKNVPNAVAFVKALVSALVITFIRPPSLA